MEPVRGFLLGLSETYKGACGVPTGAGSITCSGAPPRCNNAAVRAFTLASNSDVRSARSAVCASMKEAYSMRCLVRAWKRISACVLNPWPFRRTQEG